MNARIMVVEDEEALTTLLRYNLDAEGYEVETVGRISLMEHDLTAAKPASARDRHQPPKLRLGQAAEELDIAHKRSVTVVTRRVSPLRQVAKTGRRSAVSWI